jgi:hypothetical protein
VKAAIASLLAIGTWSCGEYDCSVSDPALDVTVRIGALATTPASLDLSAEVGGEKYSMRFDVSTALADGQTSLRIRLDESGERPVDILLTARAFSLPDGQGEMLAETTHLVAASPDGCNNVIIDLFPRRLVCETTCTADCQNADLCPVQCSNGARCSVDCRAAGKCQVNCDAGSSCSIDCTGSADCSEVRCGAEASCALFCGATEQCTFLECAGIQQTCADGTVICNAFCP